MGSHIHSLIEQIFFEPLLCVRYCFRHQGYGREQNHLMQSCASRVNKSASRTLNKKSEDVVLVLALPVTSWAPDLVKVVSLSKSCFFCKATFMTSPVCVSR